MKEENKAPMVKETVQLEDGRYLIYYSFDLNAETGSQTPKVIPGEGKGEA